MFFLIWDIFSPTADQAMEHTYFKQYHDPNDEPIADGHIEVDIEQDLSIGGKTNPFWSRLLNWYFFAILLLIFVCSDQWRQMIWDEIEAFQQQQQERIQQEQQRMQERAGGGGGGEDVIPAGINHQQYSTIWSRSFSSCWWRGQKTLYLMN